MSHLVVQTKLTVQSLDPQHAPRPHLVDQLERLIREKPLTLVVAPAGYGKSALLTEWAGATALDVCWYWLETVDAEPHRFLMHWIAAIEKKVPQFGLKTKAMLQTFVEQNVDLETLVITAVNELSETAKVPFAIVVDDYHLVDGVPQINAFVGRFVELAPSTCHVVLTAREMPSLPNLLLMVAHSAIGTIDESVLTFQVEDARALLRRRFDVDVSDSELEDLIERTEGWVMGLLLSSFSGLNGVTHPRHRLSKFSITAYEYLAEEVFARQPEHLRLFLLRASLFVEFSASLCDTVFEASWLPAGCTWQDLIDEAMEKGLFLVATSVDMSNVRFHNLFQTFLLDRLAKERPRDRELILARYTMLLQKEREWERAYEICRQLGDERLTVDLIVSGGLSLLASGRTQLVEQWIGSLSPTGLYHSPELVLVRARLMSMLDRSEESLHLFDAALTQLKERRGIWYLRARAWRADAFLNQHEFDQALAECNEVLRLVPETTDAVHVTTRCNQRRHPATLRVLKEAGGAPDLVLYNLRASCYETIAKAQFRQRRLQEAIDAGEKAIQIHERIGNDIQAVKLRARIVLFELYMGQFRNARTQLQQYVRVLKENGDIYFLGEALLWLAEVSCWQGRLVTAVESLAEAMHSAAQSRNRRMQAMLWFGWERPLSLLNLPDVADQLFERAIEAAQGLDDLDLMLHINLWRALMSAVMGKGAQAQHHLQTACDLLTRTGSGGQYFLYDRICGTVELLVGDPTRALEMLQSCLTQEEYDEAFLDRMELKVALAAAYQAVGDGASARSLFVQVLDWLRHNDGVIFFALFSLPFADWLRRIDLDDEHAALLAEHEDIARRQERELQRSLRYLAPDPIRPLLRAHKKAQPILAIRTLGTIDIRYKGETLTNAMWQTIVSRDLLLHFLVHPKGLTREEVGAVFWPEASAAQVRMRFKNALYRLRQALGKDVVVYDDGVYHFNWDLDYAYDVVRFQECIDTESRWPSEDQRIAALEEGLAVYNGDYCPDLNHDWVTDERHRLHNLYRKALDELAGLYYRQQRFAEVLATCEAMIRVDVCWEEAYRLAMLAHAEMGNRKEAIRQYDACRAALMHELNIAVSPATEEIYLSVQG